MTPRVLEAPGLAPPLFPFPRQARRGLGLAGALAALLLVLVGVGRLAPEVAALTSGAPLRRAIAMELARTHAPADLATFYLAQDDRPLWIERDGLWPFWTRTRLRPEAHQLAAMVAAPALAAALDAAGREDPAALAHAEVALSRALADDVLRRPLAGAGLSFVDPSLAPPKDRRALLEAVAQAPSLAQRLDEIDAVNPVYNALRRDLARYHAEWSRLPQVRIPNGPTLALGATGPRVATLRLRLGQTAAAAFDPPLAASVRRFQAAHGLPPSGEADAATLAALNAGARHYERLIAANLERARALPPVTARRYILVNVAAGRLWTYENGKVKDSVRVIVGAPRDETPMMAGVVRYFVVNPYWNLPVDLVRDSLAPKVLKTGPGYLAAENLQVLADWGDDAAEVDPHDVDWAAVAAGRQELRVRQRPGGDNMMGTVKFMMPNELGVYLHDTPDKSLFQSPLRLMSAGGVQVERAADLKRWLLGRDTLKADDAAPDQRVDLDQPTPVYVTYLTAAPGPSGVAFYPDVYGRDPALLAQIP